MSSWPDSAPTITTSERDSLPRLAVRLMSHLLSNFSWLFLSQIGRIVTQMLGLAIIARILTPADFGVIAIAFAVSNLAGLFRDMGTGPAAIRSSDGSSEFLGGIYTVQLFISLIVGGILLLASRPLANFYSIDSLASVLVVFALVFPLSALGGVHLIVLERAQRYRDISAIELLSYTGGLLAAILLARAGFGVVCLAAQAVVNSGIQTMLVRRAAGIVLRPRHPRHARSALGGSLAVASFHLMNYLVRNSDIAVAGRMATVDFVGTYSMSCRIAQIPTQLIGMLVSRVSIPMLSAVHADRGATSRTAESIIVGSLLTCTAVCIVLLAMRQTVTSIFFGAQWLGSVPQQLVWLLPAAAFTSTTAVTVGVMTALGATRSLTWTGVFSAVAHVVALVGCLSVAVSWLPVAILLSALIGVVISLIHLRMVQSTQAMAPIRVMGLLPTTFLLLVCTFWQDTLLSGRAAESVRSLGQELTEGAGMLLLLFATSSAYWREWWARRSSNQISAQLRKNG